jgi:Predicted membrane protein
MKQIRYRKLDGIRGIALLNMIAFHAAWDLVYLYGVQWNWYQSTGGYIWQQGICWTFIFLSGFCLPLGKHPVKRGLTVFLGGAVITVVTLVLMPQNRVVFGVLTLIGSCMVIVGVFDRLLQKMIPVFGLFISLGLFAVMRNVNEGWLGFEAFRLCEAPKALYACEYPLAKLVAAYLGFPGKDFYSTDYFSMIPWLFLFLSGYFFFRLLDKSEMFGVLEKGVLLPVEWIGKHSFAIYMLHQPVIYLALEIIF